MVFRIFRDFYGFFRYFLLGFLGQMATSYGHQFVRPSLMILTGALLSEAKFSLQFRDLKTRETEIQKPILTKLRNYSKTPKQIIQK